ncbi:glycosyltransferase family 2 protein [Enterococcus sp. CSURQ0835]|uniref:glycosyltransferase family 2 protein n=1 Tax=Enterococcus sp. CSURQ0835 TaxID=2681394 RepID=UPI00135A1612|nr:glycosyltransferase family 2 protein [Enterococcus sp. CSURQ0835]
MKVLLIIPAYNEEDSILKTIQAIETFKQSVDYQLDYLVINDCSTDRTKELLVKHQINAIHLILNLGIGGAVQTGYKYAARNQYDIAVQFDGDGQHDINSLNQLLAPIMSGKANLTIGSRFVKGSTSQFQTSFMRRLGVKVISFFIKLVTGFKVYDTTSGYRAADKKVLNLFAHRYPVKYPEPETIVHTLKRRLKVQEVGVNMFERQGGTSSITPFKSIRYMTEVCLSILVATFMKETD